MLVFRIFLPPMFRRPAILSALGFGIALSLFKEQLSHGSVTYIHSDAH